MTSLTTERAAPVEGSVRGIFGDLNALFCVYYEPCSSGDRLDTVRDRRRDTGYAPHIKSRPTKVDVQASLCKISF